MLFIICSLSILSIYLHLHRTCGIISVGVSGAALQNELEAEYKTQ